MFAGPDDSKWVCMNCGYIHEGEEAPINAHCVDIQSLILSHIVKLKMYKEL